MTPTITLEHSNPVSDLTEPLPSPQNSRFQSIPIRLRNPAAVHDARANRASRVIRATSYVANMSSNSSWAPSIEPRRSSTSRIHLAHTPPTIPQRIPINDSLATISPPLDYYGKEEHQRIVRAPSAIRAQDMEELDRSERERADYIDNPTPVLDNSMSTPPSDNSIAVSNSAPISPTPVPPPVSPDIKKLYRSSVHLYESFVQSIEEGQTTQANMLKNDFHHNFLTMLEHMPKNQTRTEMPKSRTLEQKMYKMQRRMFDLQQQVLQRLANIQSRIQAILVQNTELHEHPGPRLFIILPTQSNSGPQWDSEELLRTNQFQLHFLCECGVHTKSIQSSKTPHHIHLANHDGYILRNQEDFFRLFGSYVLSLLQMLKYGTTAAGFSIPPLASSLTDQTGRSNTLYNAASNTMEAWIDQSIDYILSLSPAENPPTSTQGHERQLGQHGHAAPRPIGVEDLRQLGLYLERGENSSALGNLHRMVTNEAHVRWVCTDHFHEAYGTDAIKELADSVAQHQGTFDDRLCHVNLSLPSRANALKFYRVINRAKCVQELKVALTWDVSFSDLKELQDVLHGSCIASLDLTCTPSTATSEVLNRNKRADPLWQMAMISGLYSFVLSGYTGFFARVSIPARVNNLRIIKITESIDWKKDSAKVVELLRQCPLLTDLRLGCTDVEATYGAIRDVSKSLVLLEYLSLDGGLSDGIQVRFQNHELVWMDLITSNPSNSIMLSASRLRNLHIRPGLGPQAELKPQLLEALIAKNRSMRTLVIQCHTTAFQQHLMIVKEAVKMNEPSQLMTLSLYGHRNQLLATKLTTHVSIKLELLSTSLTAETLESLLKAYGSRLTKLRIKGEAIVNCLSRLEK
ncbi:hypothetical protein BGZ98_000248, partial [Dissophora globulifera]